MIDVPVRQDSQPPLTMVPANIDQGEVFPIDMLWSPLLDEKLAKWNQEQARLQARQAYERMADINFQSGSLYDKLYEQMIINAARAKDYRIQYEQAFKNNRPQFRLEDLPADLVPLIESE